MDREVEMWENGVVEWRGEASGVGEINFGRGEFCGGDAGDGMAEFFLDVIEIAGIGF